MTMYDKITVLWYASESKLSWLIRWVTGSPFSHVAIMLDGRLYEALGSGIVALEGDEARERAAEAIAHKHLTVKRTDVEQADMWLSARVANRYSILGFLAAGIGTLTRWRIVIALDGTYICSGLAAKALEIAGIFVDGEARLQTPESLARLLEPEYSENPSRDVSRLS